MLFGWWVVGNLRILLCIFMVHTSTAVAVEAEQTIAYQMSSHEPLSLAAQVGQKMFFDTTLSGSRSLACSSCHDPNYAYAPPNALAVQPGGQLLNLSGTRAVPSLRYKQVTPAYADVADNPDGISAPGPGGGLTQDGRSDTLAAQARIPLLSVNEMANEDPTAVVNAIRKSAYATLFEKAFGAGVFATPEIAFERATQALQAFQQEDYSFHPFSSKYDLFVSNKKGGDLTESELRGMAVFVRPDKGNCAACHYAGPGIAGSSGMFTDYSYAAIGVPRNPDIPANRTTTYFDLGICSRPDHAPPVGAAYCGMFKTPTLRNVATRGVFFHNGQIKTLKEAIQFYNTRDTDPGRWYPTVRGRIAKYNDLPRAYQRNIDAQEPLSGRKAGGVPAMSSQEMEDLESFLGVLTDDYELRHPVQ